MLVLVQQGTWKRPPAVKLGISETEDMGAPKKSSKHGDFVQENPCFKGS